MSLDYKTNLALEQAIESGLSALDNDEFEVAITIGEALMERGYEHDGKKLKKLAIKQRWQSMRDDWAYDEMVDNRLQDEMAVV